MIAERNPQVGKAVVRLRELSADEKARDLYERREKALRDIDSRERWAREQGIQQGGVGRALDIAKRAKGMNMPIDDIAKLTGLTHEEIEGISDVD